MSRSNVLWWLNPAAPMVLLHAPLLIASFLIPDWAYQSLWFAPKYLDTYSTALVALVIVVWLFGFLVVKQQTNAPEPVPSADTGMLAVFFNVSWILTLAGYAVMLVAATVRGLNVGLLLGAVQGEANVMAQLKDVYFATIPGLTTLTQFGPATAVLGTLLAQTSGWRTVRGRLITLLVLACLRAFFASERLALLEIAIPAAILVAHFLRVPSGKGQAIRRILIQGFPIVALVCLLVVFAASEYFRSWANFYARKGGDFVTFALYRATGYYSTAYNNSAFLLYNFDQSSLIPQFTAEWLWRFPGLNLLLGEGPEVVTDRYRAYMALLKSGVNPEFNNSGGFLMPVIDYGIVGGSMFWLFAGMVTRKLFDSFKHFRTTGMLLFPVFMIGILEASRLIYWTSGRVFPSLAMLLTAAFFLNRTAGDEPRPGYQRVPAEARVRR